MLDVVCINPESEISLTGAIYCASLIVPPGLIGALDPQKYESILEVNALQAVNAEERRSKDQARGGGGGDKSVITVLRRMNVNEFYLGEATVRQREAAGELVGPHEGGGGRGVVSCRVV